MADSPVSEQRIHDRARRMLPALRAGLDIGRKPIIPRPPVKLKIASRIGWPPGGIPGAPKLSVLFSACDWLAALTAHIPNAGEHLVRYYGWYSNVSRGKRRKAQEGEASHSEELSGVGPSEAKRACLRRAKPRRARLIKQAYEADPLVFPRCAGAMRIIAFIEQPEVVAKILTHLKLCSALSGPKGLALAHSPPEQSIAA